MGAFEDAVDANEVLEKEALALLVAVNAHKETQTGGNSYSWQQTLNAKTNEYVVKKQAIQVNFDLMQSLAP